MNKLSILVPSIPETKEYLILCLNSIEQHRDSDTDVYVWANGHGADDLQALRDMFPKIRFIHTKQNYGQSLPMNRWAAEFITSKYMMVLNDDMVVGPNFDLDMVAHIEKRPDLILLSPKLIEPGTKVPVAAQFITQNFGDSFDTFNKDKFEMFIKEVYKDSAYIIGEHSLPFIMERAKFNALGGWDERMTLGPCADVDFYKKIEVLGFKTAQVQDVFVYHFSGKATRLNPTFKFADVEARNNELLFRKWQ